MTIKIAMEDGMDKGKGTRRKTCVEEGTLQNMTAYGTQRKGWWAVMVAFGGKNIEVSTKVYPF
ncbi:formate C-acetyltransferase/glycerol dehydratase family glycyl [Sesbania bispinosa]|nr:formate C-acetyltransferase/glycerol dehydratase family glycyl [Sesbania bispinosa]